MRTDGAPESIRGSQLSDAAERLSHRLDEVTAAMLSRILDEVPVYRRLPPDGLSNVEQLASRNTRVLSEALRTGGRLNREDLRYVAEHARERLRRGVSLESMLHAYRVGLTAFWEECIAEGVALGFSRDTALELARRTSELSDDLTTHAAETYVREESRLRALNDQAARDLLEMLLRGEHDSEVLRSHLAFPGLDSAEKLVVVLGRISSSAKPQSDALETASQALSRALLTGRASPLVAVRTGTVVAVAAVEAGVSVPERLHRVHDELRAEGTQVLCGLSSPRSGIAGIPGGFDQAALAISRASAERPVVSLSELPVIQNLLLGASSTMRSLLAAKAREIDLDGRDPLPMMRETLQAFGDADMNVTRTARALHVHPNTLRYRLRRIRERTGRDPHTFLGLVDLICLVALLSEASQEGDTPSSGQSGA
jgi:sugar diacid utilization regulator